MIIFHGLEPVTVQDYPIIFCGSLAVQQIRSVESCAVRIKARLIFLVLSFIILVAIGTANTGSLRFLLTQFWFTAGFFLLILLSLIDQPFFSRDSNIFVNACTAWVSLLLVEEANRHYVWWSFLIWATYLIVSSYVLMWLRRNELREEPRWVQFASRVNRQIGRPEAIFSAFFLWGAVVQFGTNSNGVNSLFLFWAVFMILNLPGLSNTIDRLFEKSQSSDPLFAGIVLNTISPKILEVALTSSLPANLIGRVVTIKNVKKKIVGSGVLVDDRVVTGKRIGRAALLRTEDGWSSIGDSTQSGEITIDMTADVYEAEAGLPLSVVDSDTDIGKIVFHIHPRLPLEAGEVLSVKMDSEKHAFYQVISARVCLLPLRDGDRMHSIRVTAGQLGVWDEMTFPLD